MLNEAAARVTSLPFARVEAQSLLTEEWFQILNFFIIQFNLAAAVACSSTRAPLFFIVHTAH